MKKILLLLFICTSFSLAGQPYHVLLGDTTEWNVVRNVFPVVHQRSFYIIEGDHRAFGDTLISGTNYKLFEQQWLLLPGYIREDTSLQKVWFREDGASPELLLYDFSLNQGDSTLLTFPNYISGDPYPTGWYFVDTIIIRNTITGPRKFYYLSNPASPINPSDNGNRFYLVWIEGVGSNIHPVYIYIEEGGSPQFGPLTMYCPAYLHLALACSHKDGIQQFFDTCFWNNLQIFADDSCHYYFPGGINELNSSSLIFSPNPTTNKLKIQNAELRIKNIEIYNVLGERVYKSESPKTEIDVTNLHSGIYLVKVTTDKTNFFGKFIKE